jgi:hypothetical protein
MTDETFSWGELGEAWWRENGEACRATEQQIKFACARHQGANKSRSARLVGYSGNAEALRTAGVRAAASKAVCDLLTLAAAEDSTADPDNVTDAEIERKLTKLIRNPDGALALKAIEARAKFAEQRRQRGETPENDGYFDWRMEREFCGLPNGASAYLLLKGGAIGNLCLLHDTYSVLMREPLGPELWQRFYAALNNDAREALDQHLADPGWQLDARRHIWGEIGLQPPGPLSADAVDFLKRDRASPPSGNGAEAPANA